MLDEIINQNASKATLDLVNIELEKLDSGLK